MERELLVSRIQTPDGTILTSTHRHDYVTYTDKNGETYMLDGGAEYVRTSINKEPAANISIYTDSPFEEIRNNLVRNTADGRQVLLKDMTVQHLYNCIIYKSYENENINKFKWQYIRELAYRCNKVLGL